MIWDRVVLLYDLAVNALNKRVYNETGDTVAGLTHPGNTVFECAYGTGVISVAITPTCTCVVITDYSKGMLKQACKELMRHSNVIIEQTDITDLHYVNDSSDTIMAGNVIHLLPEPSDALKKFKWVMHPGGTIVMPTYVIPKKRAYITSLNVISRFDVHLQEHSDPTSYRVFSGRMDYMGVTYRVMQGRVPYAIASFTDGQQMPSPE